jgi:hypothetical protein
MTRIVARLEERGLIQRTPHPTDGRQVILAPSPLGRELLVEYQRVRDEWLANRIAGLTRRIVMRCTAPPKSWSGSRNSNSPQRTEEAHRPCGHASAPRSSRSWSATTDSSPPAN